MSRLDKMWEFFEANVSIDAVKPINPKAKEILKNGSIITRNSEMWD